jgi:hypothetical protein
MIGGERPQADGSKLNVLGLTGEVISGILQVACNWLNKPWSAELSVAANA